MKVAVLLWAVETTAQEDREVDKLDEPFPEPDYYIDSLKHARKYPYDCEVLTFKISKDRKRLLKYSGLEKFPLQAKWEQISTTSPLDRVIFASDVGEIDLARRNFKIGEKSQARIRALLEERKLKLRHYLDSGQEGFVVGTSARTAGPIDGCIGDSNGGRYHCGGRSVRQFGH